ncbi:MAG: DUF86 domain-containing protein [Elusimicrobiota bacterium]
MKVKRNYKIFINDIWDSINKIEEFVLGICYEDFLKDDKTVSAVVRKLEIIGEDTKNIPASIRQKYSNVNWKGMAGMRDKLIHDYSGADTEILWKVIKKDIVEVKPKIKSILKDINAEK